MKAEILEMKETPVENIFHAKVKVLERVQVDEITQLETEKEVLEKDYHIKDNFAFAVAKGHT